MALTDKLTAIADAIRGKTGKTAVLTLDQMTEDLNAIPNRTADDLVADGAVVIVPAGNYHNDVSKSVETAAQAAPIIEVSSSGLITATAGTQSATKQLSAQAAKTVTPKASSQVAVMARMYTTGAVTVAGDINLKAANIKSGVSIFGVEGTYEGSGGTDSGSIETCTVQFTNATTSTLVFWYAKVSNGKIVNTMKSVGPGSAAQITDAARNSLLAYMPMGTVDATIGSPTLVNAMYAVGCDHSAAVQVGSNGTEVSVTVNMLTS